MINVPEVSPCGVQKSRQLRKLLDESSLQLKCASFDRLVEVARVNKVRRNSDQPVYVCTRTDTAGNLPQQSAPQSSMPGLVRFRAVCVASPSIDGPECWESSRTVPAPIWTDFDRSGVWTDLAGRMRPALTDRPMRPEIAEIPPPPDSL